MKLGFYLFLITSVINNSIISMIFLSMILYGAGVLVLGHLQTSLGCLSIVSFIQNNLVTYNASITLNNLYNFGFLLAIFMVLQIISGIILSIYYNFSFYSIVYIVKDIVVGWIFRYFHSMNCSLIHFFLVVHIMRGIYYLSYISTANIWISGLILYILIVVVSFLGYVLPYGQMSYWGATVITNIVALFPNLMELLLGNYVMSSVTLKRFYILHFLLSLILMLVMIVHIIYLHKLGSTNPLYKANIKISFYPYFYSKDLYIVLVFLGILILNYFNLIELSHSDNNIEVNPLVTPLHIVPEWYFLSYYTVLKCVNAKVAGILIMVSFFVLLFNIVSINYSVVLVWSSNNLFILFDWFALYVIMAFIGAKLPLAIYLYLAKIFIIMIYVRMLTTSSASFSGKGGSTTMSTYFAINSYAYYYTLVNLLLYLQYAVVNANTELNDGPINYYVLLGFIIFSEAGLFLSFFALLFNYNSVYIYVNHYHLYYIGLLILCHASVIANGFVLFLLSMFFVNLQILEYRNMAYTINHNNYTSVFYLITTLHLLHVLVGVYLLTFVYSNYSVFTKQNSALKLVCTTSQRSNEYSLVVVTYWNFVELLWLLIFFLYSYFSNREFKNIREFSSLNHKLIGFNYYLVGVYFGLIAIVYSILIRVELFSSGSRIIFEQNNFIYNFLISLHGLMMIFFFVMPLVFAAFGNVYFPLNINAAELKLAKLNNLSLCLLMLSFLFVINASLLEFGIGVGWTLSIRKRVYMFCLFALENSQVFSFIYRFSFLLEALVRGTRRGSLNSFKEFASGPQRLQGNELREFLLKKYRGLLRSREWFSGLFDTNGGFDFNDMSIYIRLKRRDMGLYNFLVKLYGGTITRSRSGPYLKFTEQKDILRILYILRDCPLFSGTQNALIEFSSLYTEREGLDRIYHENQPEMTISRLAGMFETTILFYIRNSPDHIDGKVHAIYSDSINLYIVRDYLISLGFGKSYIKWDVEKQALRIFFDRYTQTELFIKCFHPFLFRSPLLYYQYDIWQKSLKEYKRLKKGPKRVAFIAKYQAILYTKKFK